MSRESRLIKNTVLITFSKMSIQIINFILLPVYTTLLTIEEFGIVDLLSTFISLLAPIVTFQLEHGLFRFLIDVRYDNKEKSQYITTALYSTTMQSLVFLVLVSVISSFINNKYKYFLATNVVAHVFSSLLLQISRGLGDNSTYALGTVVQAISAIILNILLVVGLRLEATGMLLATLIANIVCVVFIFIRRKIYHYIKFKMFNFQKLKTLLMYSIPLLPNALSWWIINASDRAIITAFIGIGANGIYAASNKFSGVFMTFYNIFNLTWTESASMHINDIDREKFFTKIINIAFRLFSSLCFGIIAVMPFVFSLIIHEQFEEAYYHIPILMISSLFNVVIGLYSVVYIAQKQTKKVANTSIIAGVINIITNVLLINKIGLYAASISTAVSFFAMMVFRYIDLQKNMDLKFDKRLIISSILMIIMLFITYYHQNFTGHLISLIITIGYSVFINRKTIIDIISFFKKEIVKYK